MANETVVDIAELFCLAGRKMENELLAGNRYWLKLVWRCLKKLFHNKSVCQMHLWKWYHS